MSRHENLAVYVSVPCLGGTVQRETAVAAYRDHGAECPLVHSNRLSTSLLGQTFNLEWANALALANRGQATHFAMLHADVIPENGWLGTLLDELERFDADVISALCRIKNNSGTCSVALCGNPWEPRLLTLPELMNAPPTFSLADVARDNSEKYLLVNTGCLLVDLRGGWAHETDERGFLKTFFTIHDRVMARSDGGYHVEVQSEDWNFSRMAADAGARVLATKRVTTRHRGIHDYGSRMS